MSDPKFMADLETTTDPNDCRVWAWGLVEIGHEDVEIGTSMDRLMELILSEKGTTYFHNLKFDGEFVMLWLYEHGFSLEKSSKNMPDYTFSPLISDHGQFYSIKIKTPKVTHIIKDSLKIIPLPVDKIGGAFGLPMSKGEIDYDKPRQPGYIPDDKEKSYISRDVLIVAKALKQLFEQGLTASTQASNALQDYKKIVNPKNFKMWYPIFPKWKHMELAQSYKGGYTIVNPRFKNKNIKEGIVLDKNSMYPWVMYTKPLPIDDPLYFEGEYVQDDIYPLYIQMITCNFRVKKDHLPTIQIKYPGPWNPTDYLESSEVIDKKTGEKVETQTTLCLTNVDLQLFKDHYDIYNLEYLGGYKFRQSTGLFTEYVDKWYGVKEQATKDGNKGMRQIAKIMLNALYGKFGTSPVARNKWPVYANGKLRYVTDKEDTEKDPIYVPVAAFITSYAREECIRCAQAVYDRFLYADTDSLHLIGTEKPDLDIHPTRLGAWKCESVFKRGKYIRAKTYVEDIYDITEEVVGAILDGYALDPNTPTKLNVKCAGLPSVCHSQVTFDNFRPGAKYQGKLTPQHVVGGIVLMPTTYEIKG